NEEINRIKLISNYEEAVNAFETLCNQFESKYSSYIKMLKTNKERYLSYKKYPEAIRKHIYTTNIVENINSKLEGLRVNHGGYFQSVKTAEISIYVIVNRIIQGRWKKPLTVSKEVLYEIRQIFNSRFTE
ncbi:transposase, partial [Thermodesulfovibrio thiophilus]|uniref:transposase n=1 Tax=Thermodesulfovibrio thiophilus TaxID=340095 RepID=UPI00048CAA93